MVHGDEQGLVLPPRIASNTSSVNSSGTLEEESCVMEKLDELYAALKAKGIRVRLDDSDQSPGYKFNEWELKGVPVRVDLGPCDLEQQSSID